MFHSGSKELRQQVAAANRLIQQQIRWKAGKTAEVYIYRWKQDVYPTIVQNHGGHRWLVMFNLAGIMETAFPPTDPDEYLADPRFQRIGTITVQLDPAGGASTIFLLCRKEET